MTAEDALHIVFKPCLKQFVRTHSAEDAVCALTVFGFVVFAHRTVDKLGRAAVGYKFIADVRCFTVAEFVDYVRPGVAVFAQRNVEEHKVVDGFIAVCFSQLRHFAGIPIDLALVDIVVFPRRAEVVAVDVAVAVERYERLIDAAVRIFDHEHIIAEAHCVVADIVLFVANARVEQAILEISFLIIVADIHARITAVIFGVVVAERERPVHAEGFHHFRENHRGVFVVERARLERYGVRDIARDHDKVGLLFSYHRRDGVHCPRVLFVRKRAAADMDVGELQHLEIAAVFLRKYVVSEAFVKRRDKLRMLGIFDFVKTLPLLDKRLRADSRTYRATAKEYRKDKHDACRDNQRFYRTLFLFFGRKDLFLFLSLFTRAEFGCFHAERNVVRFVEFLLSHIFTSVVLFFGVFAVIFNDKFNFRTRFFANFSGNVGKYVFVAVFHDDNADFCAVTVIVKFGFHNGHADLFALFVYRFFLVVCAVTRHNRLYVVPDCLYRKYDNRNAYDDADNRVRSVVDASRHRKRHHRSHRYADVHKTVNRQGFERRRLHLLVGKIVGKPQSEFYRHGHRYQYATFYTEPYRLGHRHAVKRPYQKQPADHDRSRRDDKPRKILRPAVAVRRLFAARDKKRAKRYPCHYRRQNVKKVVDRVKHYAKTVA